MLRPGISWCTTASVYLEMHEGDAHVANGSGFVVQGMRVIPAAHAHLTERPYLITARHNLTGTDAEGHWLSERGSRPTWVRVWWLREGTWTSFDESLLQEPGVPAWHEHPAMGPEIDVVALPLSSDVGEVPKYDPYAIQRTPIAWGIASELKVIGFPYRLKKTGGLPVWTRGTVATEPSEDFNGLPMFLIDGRTRKGQSGSPVVLWSDGSSFPDDSGKLAHSPAGALHCLVGIYSGRVDEESDLGFVWKAEIIDQILAAAAPSAEEIKSWSDAAAERPEA